MKQEFVLLNNRLVMNPQDKLAISICDSEDHFVTRTGMNEAGVSSIANFASASSGDFTPAAVLQHLDTSIPMPSSSTIRGDIIVIDPTDPKRVGSNCDQVENSSFPIASGTSPPTNLLASDPSVGFTEPPHVPESFPRDPVPQGGRGEGWPYAPQGWPKPEDKWGWRVGRRAAANSLWIDRYITVPVSLMKGKRSASKVEFASRKSLVGYLRQNFPQMKDPYSIFKAFDWKVPAPENFEAPEKPEKRGPTVIRDKPSPMDGDDNWQKSKKQCRAGNPHCILTKAKDSEPESLGSLVCHICCSEPSFCRECKCILCCKFFAPDADDFSIIRCLNFPLSGQGICGHAAHLECALDSQLAGVIKKNGLDMEYICRRCDRKTHLKETLSRLVEFMSKTATQSKVESSLQLALRIVQDPEDEARSSGNIQTTLIGALKKVQGGADIFESYKELLSSLLDQSVCKPPTLSIEEHIRQCEAMTDRVKGAVQLNNPPSVFTRKKLISAGIQHLSVVAEAFRRNRLDVVINHAKSVLKSASGAVLPLILQGSSLFSYDSEVLYHKPTPV